MFAEQGNLVKVRDLEIPVPGSIRPSRPLSAFINRGIISRTRGSKTMPSLSSALSTSFQDAMGLCWRTSVSGQPHNFDAITAGSFSLANWEPNIFGE